MLHLIKLVAKTASNILCVSKALRRLEKLQAGTPTVGTAAEPVLTCGAVYHVYRTCPKRSVLMKLCGSVDLNGRHYWLTAVVITEPTALHLWYFSSCVKSPRRLVICVHVWDSANKD